jgi:hypothetical protein
MEDSLELVISDWEDHDGDPRILPLLRELAARRRAAEAWVAIAEYAKATVPYVLATIGPGCTMPSDEKDWIKAHKGRMNSSHNQLTELLKRVQALR